MEHSNRIIIVFLHHATVRMPVSVSRKRQLLIVYANEHMGQLIAYARMTGVVPPWSKKPNE